MSQRPPATRSATPRSWAWRLTVPAALAVAGLLASTSMINAHGTDLRAGRYTDLVGLVSEQRGQVQELYQQTRTLQSRVHSLAQQVSGTRVQRLQRQVERVGVSAGTRGLVGPGLVVTLDDAPSGQPLPPGTDPNLLIVHQQDLQAVVNALWAGGAEGMSLQGQRIISTTGVKCVGNTVVLQGVPYSPPYRMVAVGDSRKMYRALLVSPAVQNYRDYIRPPYNLGWSLKSERRLALPAYSGALTAQFATPTARAPGARAGG